MDGQIGAAAYQEGEIEVASDLNLRPDRYYLASRVERLSDVKLVIAGRSNAGGPIFSLVDPRFTDTPFCETARRLGFGGLLGASEYPIYWETLTRLSLDRSIALIWNGSEPYVDFMLHVGYDFDYYPRGYPDTSVSENVTLVPESLILETYAPSLGPLRDFMLAHPPTPPLRRFLLGTPPPIFSSTVIKDRMSKESFFSLRAGEFGFTLDDLVVMPAQIRRKLWFTLQSAMADLSEETGWTFIPAPEGCFDEQGYLRLEFSAGDCTHANAEFGRLINFDMIKVIEERGL